MKKSFLEQKLNGGRCLKLLEEDIVELLYISLYITVDVFNDGSNGDGCALWLFLDSNCPFVTAW